MAGYSFEKRGDFCYLIWDQFVKTGLVVHAFTTRLGGVSKDHNASLNMAFHVGDDQAVVTENRRIACTSLGIAPGDLVAGEQVHGDVITIVGDMDRGRGALSEETALPRTDALITSVKGVPLSSYYADCVPIFLLDPVRRVAGLVHAGWRGTVLKIGQRAVQAMTSNFGTDPFDCLACIAPSIGPCCYEVDEPVFKQFKDNFVYWRDLAQAVKQGHWVLDLWGANTRILLESGLKRENISVSEICTSCNSHLFYSYRAHGGKTGRMASIMMLL